MRIFLTVLLSFLLLTGCVPTTTLIFLNNSNMDLIISIENNTDSYIVSKKHDLIKGGKDEILVSQGFVGTLFIMGKQGGTYNYRIATKKEKSLHAELYIAILPDWTLAVYDSMSDLKSPIDKAQYLILPLNPENESQQK